MPFANFFFNYKKKIIVATLKKECTTFTLGNLRIKRTILHSLRDIIEHEFLLQTKIFLKKSTSQSKGFL